jgi:predicted nucleic acid-binding protein
MLVPATATASPAAVPNFVHSIRSDDLPKFTAVLRQIAVFRDHIDVFQVDVILDANVVISDLLWLARKRIDPSARTKLMELMDCEVVRAHAPSFLIREINLNLPLLAAEHAIDLKVLLALWQQYRTRIRFVPVGGPAKRAVHGDPKDAPYLRLQKKLSYPIASRDTDIPRMGGTVVRIQVFSTLRAYSRQTAVEFHLKVSGVMSAMILAGMIEGGVALAKRIPSLPKPVLWGGAALFGLLLLHPASRKRILEVGADLISGGALALEAIYRVVEPMLAEHYVAQETARLSLIKARLELACPTSSKA